MARKREPASRWPAALLVLCSFALRVFRLGDANLWWDEALAIFAVRKGFAGVTAWTAADVHPPLYFWSLWSWIQLVGESEFATRLLSTIFGVLTVIIVYRLGRRLRGERLGLLAAFLIGFSRFHIWWSQELRMYVLAGLLGTLSLFHLLGWLRAETSPRKNAAKEKWRHLAGTALYGLGSLYTVLIMGALVLVQNAIAVAHTLTADLRHRTAALGRWATSQLVLVVGLLGWLAYSWGAMSTWSVAEPFGWYRMGRLYATLLTTGISVDIERYTWLVCIPLAVLLAGAVVGIVRWHAENRPRAEAWDLVTLGLVATVPPILIYVATLPRSLFYTPRLEARYLLPFAPAFWMLLAWALDALIERWRIVGWACATGIAAIWLAMLPGHYDSRHLTDELQSMVRTIASQSHEGDLVLLNSGTRYPVWSYYYDGLAWSTPKPPVVYLGDDSRKLASEEVAALLPEMVKDADRIWLAEVDIGLTDPERLVPKWLSERYPQTLALGFGANALRLFDPKARTPHLAQAYKPDIRLSCEGDRYRLMGIDLPVPVVPVGESVQIGLLWEESPADARLLIRNDHGHTLGIRRLHQPVRGPLRQQVELPLPAEMPGGSYTMAVEFSDGERCKLPKLRTVGNPRPRVTQTPNEPVGATLGTVAELVGYTLHHGSQTVPAVGSVSASAGDTLVLDLYWRARSKSERSYTVFAQLLGETINPRTDALVWGQHDSDPAGYLAPVDAWHADDLVLDRHVLTIDTQAPPRSYRLQVGMYDPETGTRLLTEAAMNETQDDRVLLPALVHVKG